MPSIRTFKTSFSAGEVSPELYGRLDLAKEQDGLANCRNMWILPHGPAQNRPGFKYINSTKLVSNKTRLVPFNFSNDQSFVVEMGDRYMRFHAQGGTVKQNIVGNGDFVTDINGWTDSTARYSWDDGKLKLDGQNTNLLGNSSFDSALTGWTTAVVGTGSSVTVDAQKRAKLTKGSTSTAAVSLNQNVTVTTGTVENYVLSCDVIGSPCRIRIVNASSVAFHDAYHDPGRVNIVFQATSSPAKVYFNGTSGAGTTYIDNVEFRDTWSYISTTVALTIGETYALSIAMVKPASVTVGSFPLTVGATTYPSGTPAPLIAGTTNLTFTATTASADITIGSPQSTDYINWVDSVVLISQNDLTPYELKTDYLESDLGQIKYAQSGDILTLVHPKYPPKELLRYSNTNWALTNISFASKVTTPAVPTVVATYPSTGTAKKFTYKITAVAKLGYEESIASPASTSVNNDLTITGNYNTITWTSLGASVIRYNIYKYASGTYGYIGQTSALTFTDDNIIADLTRTLPMFDAVFDSTDNYPSVVGYHQQRRWFGSTNNQPQNMWGTQPGTENNMNYSIPTQASDAIRFKVASQRANEIRHIVPLADLVLITASTEYRVSAGSGNAITAATMDIKPQSQYGANNVPPVIVNNYAIYSQAQGNHLRELSYQWQANGYQTKDLSVLATHLFNGDTIVDMAFSKTPQQIVWLVTGTGKLLGMTYLPDQEITAWHQHTTDGYFENICVVTEGVKDVLYAIVRRTVNGVTQRYVEMLTNRVFSSLNDGFFVDAGLSTTFSTPTSYVYGLDHLEGKTVSVLADGIVQNQKTVNSGYVVLDTPATMVTVGLPIDAYIETVPMMIAGDSSLGQGHTKNINKVWSRCTEFVGAQAGPSLTKLTDIKPLRYDTGGVKPLMTNGEVKLVVQSNWNPEGSIVIKQPNPLPLTIVDITLEVAIGG